MFSEDEVSENISENRQAVQKVSIITPTNKHKNTIHALILFAIFFFISILFLLFPSFIFVNKGGGLSSVTLT